MVGPSLGWAVGSHAIFGTTDGAHWSKQLTSTEEFVGVDFISASIGWAVGVRSLLQTTDGGRSWHPVGEGPKPLRSVHFVSPTEGWGIAGGGGPAMNHGWLLPSYAAVVVKTDDEGRTWSILDSPADPEAVCFSDQTHGWVATAGGFIYASTDGGHTWSKALEMFQARPDVFRPTIIECAAPSALWALTTIPNAAAGHVPYVAYATQDGHSWRTVLTDSYTTGNLLPGVPAGPDSYPGSLSVVDATSAVFVGDGPNTNAAVAMVASDGGRSLRRTGRIENAPETFGAAFVSVTTGWVLTRNPGGDYIIAATTDAGYHWAQQLAVPPSSAG
jgi:photosystem II stability/assembly factor-like uncharacterized protein